MGGLRKNDEPIWIDDATGSLFPCEEEKIEEGGKIKVL